MKGGKFKLHILFVLIVVHWSILTGQRNCPENYDCVHVDYIKSVKFHIDGLFLSVPIVDLNNQGGLLLSFDDLDGNVKDYRYTIVHCDKNWKPSVLSSMEYIDGFSEDRLNDYRFSFKTLTSYTHYELLLPNDDLGWTKSGNYLLKVFDDESDRKLVITRRFMVVEPLVSIIPKLSVPSNVSKSRTHQEIDFVVNHERLEIRNPRVEVTATVLQNGRWDNAITNIQPLFTKISELIFDYQDKVVFPAGKEFRYVDLRSLKFRSENVSSIERTDDGFLVYLYKDEKRFNQTFFSHQDLNGNFVIENSDQSRNFDLSSDYADVLFSLSTPTPYFDNEVYIFGGLTDWQLQEQYKMVYNNAVNAYVGTALLKQGFYDYAYAVVPSDTKKRTADLSEIEGDWYETQNTYSILVYYRPFGERYDRIIGAVTFDSN